jgi:uncharacterized membrane protein YhaH (DUF805 family)
MSEFASIFLTGEILPGFLKEDVISTLARLLKTDEHKAATLLSGRETLIKRNAAPSDVERYIRALHKAGAVACSAQAKVSFTSSVKQTSTPPAAPSAPVSTQKPQMPRELKLAPGWTKPREEVWQTTFFPYATAAPTVRARHTKPTNSPRTSRSTVTKATVNNNGQGPVYADVSSFGLSTQGRIGRLRYLAYYWPAMGLIVVAGIIAAILMASMVDGGIGGLIALIIPLAILLLWMSIRITALRLHDMNKSGKWIFLPIFIIAAAAASRSPHLIKAAVAVYWIMYVGLMLWPGSQSDNDYGPPPAPNTDWVYIGAALFLGLSTLNLIGAKQYDKYTKGRFTLTPSEQESVIDASMRNYVEQMDKKTPLMMNKMMSLDKVEYTNKVLRYKASIKGGRLNISDEQKEAMKKSMLQSYCSQVDGWFPSNKIPVDFVFRYQVTAWDFDSFTLRLAPESCS